MSQTSVSSTMEIGIAGQLADSGDNDVVSKLASVAMPFGKLAVEAATEGQCKLPGVAGDVTDPLKVLGLVLKTQAIESDSSSASDYAAGDMVNVMRKGRALVKVEQTVVVTDPVYVRYAAGGDGVGSFGNSAGTSERALLASAKYIKGAASGGLAVVELNLV